MYKEGDVVVVNDPGELQSYPVVIESIYSVLDGHIRYVTQAFDFGSILYVDDELILGLYTDTHNHPCMTPKPVYIGIGSGGYHVCKECDVKITI